MRLSAGMIALLTIGAFVGLTYIFKPQAIHGVVALAACIGIPILLFMGAVRSAGNASQQRKSRRSHGFDAEEWSRSNRHENDLGDY